MSLRTFLTLVMLHFSLCVFSAIATPLSVATPRAVKPSQVERIIVLNPLVNGTSTACWRARTGKLIAGLVKLKKMAPVQWSKFLPPRAKTARRAAWIRRTSAIIEGCNTLQQTSLNPTPTPTFTPNPIVPPGTLTIERPETEEGVYATNRSKVILFGRCSEQIENLSVLLSNADASLPIITSDCAVSGEWQVEVSGLALGQNKISVSALDVRTGDMHTKTLTVQKVTDLDGDEIEDDVDLDYVACGDTICNQRAESHFDCPIDCTNPYLVVDPANPNCSDQSNGRLQTPICSLGGLRLKTAPGDTVYLRGGEHLLNWSFSFLQGGEPGKYVTIRNYPGETPVVESGVRFNTSWTYEADLSTNDYSIYSSVELLGAFQGDTWSYPHQIVYELDMPMSFVMSLNDLQTMLYSPDSGNIPYDAAYIDCSNGRVYIRLRDTSRNPNGRIYFSNPGLGRLTIGASYFRLIGLTVQRGQDGTRTYPISSPDPADPEYKQVVQHVEWYDNVFRATRMGISDHSDVAGKDNHFKFVDNVFYNIGTQTVINSGVPGVDGRLVRCESQLTGSWSYKRNHLDHALYGSSTSPLVQGNQVLTNNFIAIGVNRGGRYRNNFIRGAFYGSNYTGGDIEISNNVMVHDEGYLLHLRSGAPGVFTVVNNLFYGRTNSTANALVFLWDQYRRGVDLIFANNVLADLNDKSNCTSLTFTHWQTVHLDHNLYAGCSKWLVINQASGVNRQFTSFEAYQADTIAQDKNSLIAPIANVVGPINGPDYTPPPGSPVVDRGECSPFTPRDYENRSRPIDGNGDGIQSCDIGAYEFDPA